MGLLVNKINESSRSRNHFAGAGRRASLPPRQTGRRRFDRPFDGLRVVSVVEPLRPRACRGAGGRPVDSRALERRCRTVLIDLDSALLTSRHPHPLRHEPTSHENRLDLVGSTWIRPFPPASRYACSIRRVRACGMLAAVHARGEPHRIPPPVSRSLGFTQCTTRQGSSNRRGAHCMEQEPQIAWIRLDSLGFAWIRLDSLGFAWIRLDRLDRLDRSDSLDAQRGSASWIVAERSLHGGRSLKFARITRQPKPFAVLCLLLSPCYLR